MSDDTILEFPNLNMPLEDAVWECLETEYGAQGRENYKDLITEISDAFIYHFGNGFNENEAMDEALKNFEGQICKVNEKEKRVVSNTGYEVFQSMKIGGKEIMLAKNTKAADGQIYLVCNYKEHGIIAQYSQAVTSDDYLEAVQEFTSRINGEVETIRAEQNALNLPTELFTAECCYPHSYSESIVDKVIAIKSEIFSPEYRRGDIQLVYVTGGSGANANTSGRAVYCTHLNNGEQTRFERHDVLGVVRPECVPDWAKESLARIQGEKEKPAEEKEYAGNYEIIERIKVGKKVFALGHNEKAPNPYGTWEGRKDRKNSFDYGHYFNSYEDAKTDLQDRSAKEQQFLTRHKRSDKDNR